MEVTKRFLEYKIQALSERIEFKKQLDISVEQMKKN
ncbi:Uncharacterised protein [Clostridioides difficile]|nr:Uncharacterised protein [Clostridioides difficile]VIB27739.1 Uncharacterised protein [Clostridioides difficile]VIB34372.1 Uncharacterised protein [Clostridioides difficile]VIB47286.1 Uncharacterised protein [Clostridioides difficile]VIG94680.1 Uncharacterised protein [Clostridioides difficile]